MRKYFTLSLCLISVLFVHAQQSNIIGVLNDVSIDKSFNEGSEAIKASMLDSLGNMNLYEYSHCLKELYELVDFDSISVSEWDAFIGILSQEVEQENKDTIPPFYATEYKGIIPLQADFFVSSLDINTSLKEKYPQIYKDLRSSTTRLLGKGYTWEAVDTVLTIYSKNSSVGTVNFWFFLQVYNCPIIDLARTKEIEGWSTVGYYLKELRMASTFRCPLQLQYRKYRSLKQRLQKCLSNYQYELKGSIGTYDMDGKAYFNNKEGIPRELLKQF